MMKPITVAELIKALKEFDPNALVAVSSDAEGNAFSLMPNEQFVWEAFAKPELGDAEMHEKQIKGTQPVLVLFGSN